MNNTHLQQSENSPIGEDCTQMYSAIAILICRSVDATVHGRLKQFDGRCDFGRQGPPIIRIPLHLDRVAHIQSQCFQLLLGRFRAANMRDDHIPQQMGVGLLPGPLEAVPCNDLVDRVA